MPKKDKKRGRKGMAPISAGKPRHLSLLDQLILFLTLFYRSCKGSIN